MLLRVKGQVTPLASFHPWTRRADTHCQHTLAYFPYIPLCAYCHANCIPVKEEALAVLSLEKMNDNRNIKILWECIWYLRRPHPTTFAASHSVPVPQTGLCTSYFDPSKAMPGTQGAWLLLSSPSEGFCPLALPLSPYPTGLHPASCSGRAPRPSHKPPQALSGRRTADAID